MTSASYCTSYDPLTRTLHVEGELDDSGVARFRDDLARATEDFSATITVDLSDVTSLPSTAVAALAIAQHRAGQEHGRIDLVARRGSLAHRVLAEVEVPHQAR